MNEKKVLLINPSLHSSAGWVALEILPPLGLAYLAAVLEKGGFEVKIFDNYLEVKPNQYLVELLNDFDADVIGISCTTGTYLSCIDIARRIKERYPQKIIATGGPHPTLFPEQMLNSGFIDVVVIGEGEDTFYEFVSGFKNKEWNSIPGIAFRNDGNLVVNPRREPVKELDKLPMPAFHLLPMRDYPKVVEFLDVAPVYSVNTSRGCPFDCSFCSVRIIWGRSYRSFSPERVVEEVFSLSNNYGARGIYFREDNFTFSPKRVLEICRLIKERNIKIQWVCESRVEHIKEEILKEMYSAGCRAIWFGVESGSERMLKLVDKQITKENAIRAFSLCRKYRIKSGASFMLGLPGEREADMYQTLEFADDLDPYWAWFNYYLGIPGSRLYEAIIKEKLYDRIDESGIARVKTEDFDYKKVMRIRHKIMVIYYFLKPKRLIRLMVESFKAGTWMDYLIGTLKILKIYKVFL